MVAVLSAVLRACGRQTVGAAANVAGYWLLCLPLAWLLGFHLGLGVSGFWIALFVSTVLQSILFGVLIARLDWSREVCGII
jgi:multidrug resistance protein, MATE family